MKLLTLVALALVLPVNSAVALEVDTTLLCDGEVWRGSMPLDQPKISVRIAVLHSISQATITIEGAPVEVTDRLRRRLGLRSSPSAISFSDQANVVSGSVSLTSGTGIIVSQPWLVTLDCSLDQ
ncbi:hypothetical protein [Bosea sp. (in: a-proteobacteria)]|uniref:hypothetical protein n=1 Tax=Bosea sp. (in: a-proteobacteria) TaxID=1871050 RepID=UPI002B47716E|nr:hypothetical protein [Bosea sp. (in: a-proteobacteria)]WRH59308.1 MAG: hypothetical protein RSE11_05875 [Bosea sp. (in: a-proteobacteria)]